MTKAKPVVIRLPIILRELTVAAVSEVSPTMRRVTLAGPQLQAFHKDGLDLPAFRSEGPDNHVKILLPNAKTGQLALPRQLDGILDWSGDGKPTGRSYTPRAYDPASGELHIDFVLHGHGAAGLWAAAAKPGDVLHIAGPKSSLLIPEADWYLLVGDETALPAIANWLEALPKSARVTALIQIASPQSRISIDTPDAARIVWLEDADLHAETLPDAVAALGWPVGDGFVWGAAEREAVKLLRRHLIDERGHDKAALDVVAYWHKDADDEATARAWERLEQLSDLLAPHALRVATTLRLPDHIAAGATSVAALAERSGASRAGLDVLVPVLLDYGILEGTPEALQIGLLGQMLREDRHDFDHFDLDGATARMDMAWAGLREAVERGGNGYEAVFGRSFWQEMAANPALAESFDEEQAEWADYWAGPIAQHIAVPAHGRVSDIGGGTGVLLAALLEANPTASGTLVELPTALDAAGKSFAHKGLSERVTLAAQSFFEPLPVADVQVLAHVIHKWPDAEAVLILQRAAAAAGSGGDVYVIERLHAPESGRNNARRSLQMHVLFGGRERTEAQMHQLAAEASLVIVGVRTSGPDLVIHHYRVG